MRHASRMGQLLGEIVPLSALDVEEILHEQIRNKRRFGQIALGWGLCEPQHVWSAWFEQLGQSARKVDLRDLGIDAQAIAHCPRELAIAYGVVPVRSMGRQLVLATTEQGYGLAHAELETKLKMATRFILCADAQVDRALATYYPELAKVG